MANVIKCKKTAIHAETIIPHNAQVDIINSLNSTRLSEENNENFCELPK